MRARSRLTLLLVHVLALAPGALMAATVASAQQPAELEAVAERPRDEILRRAEIRSRGRSHGEVRLVARGEARAVQTLLYSKVLRKVVARIREKEAANWPASRPGHADSLTYVAALDRAGEQVREAASAKQGDRRRQLLIEFWATRSGSGVKLLEPRAQRVEDELVISDARPMEQLLLSREYVTQSMLLIAREHFPLDDEELRGLLRLAD
ncbi:MAG: hypothetical protein JRG96_03960 [Deltaproteobacteria bacterium]|nr:hypothetical protein [Deltaproteobacteria bacterium]MBW2417815.1 hypothetical protein [Deltaproteobacteria bacterium]